MKSILTLKFKRFFKSLKSVPIVSILLSIAIIGFILYIIYTQLTLFPNSYIICGVFIFILYSIHQKRRDVSLCYIVLTNPKRLFLIEYMLISVPFIVLSILSQTFFNTAIFFITPICIALLPQSKARLSLRISPVFFKKITSPELISFMRRYYLFLLLMNIAAIFLCFVPYLTPLICLIIVFFMSSAYTENEPLNMLFLPEVSPSRYLMRKINSGFLLYLAICSFPLLLYVCFNFSISHIMWVATSLLMSYAGFMLFVFVKYSMYEVNGRSITFNIPIMIGMLGIIIPIFFPVTVLMILKYYYSAKDNLEEHLYVYNK